MATGRGGSQIKVSLAFLLYGEQGVWKSSMALEFLKFKREDGKPFRVLYIDAEQGSVDTYLDNYAEAGIDTQNIYIVYTQSISEVREFIRRAKNGDSFYIYDAEGNETDEVYLDADGEPFCPDAIVVDGVTLLYIALQQSLLEFSKKRATVRASKKELVGMEREVAIDGAGIEIKDYQTIKSQGQNLILELLASGKHFAVTCREEDEKVTVDHRGEIKSISTGRKQPSGFKDVRYNVSTVLHLFKDEDGIIKAQVENKDRTQVHRQDEILVEPTLLDWQCVVGRNRTRAVFVVDNTLDNAVATECAAMEKENAKYSIDPDEVNGKLMVCTDPPDYHKAIAQIIKGLSAPEKAKKLNEITAQGLPKAYQKITDIETLNSYLSILNA